MATAVPGECSRVAAEASGALCDNCYEKKRKEKKSLPFSAIITGAS